MPEKFDLKKFLSGLWGSVNYAKVASITIKVAIVFIMILVVIWVFNGVTSFFFPKKQTAPQTQNQTIDAEPQAGGETKITNIVNNNPAPKNKIVGVWGGLDKDQGYNINVGFGWMF